ANCTMMFSELAMNWQEYASESAHDQPAICIASLPSIALVSDMQRGQPCPRTLRDLPCRRPCLWSFWGFADVQNHTGQCYRRSRWEFAKGEEGSCHTFK